MPWPQRLKAPQKEGSIRMAHIRDETSGYQMLPHGFSARQSRDLGAMRCGGVCLGKQSPRQSVATCSATTPASTPSRLRLAHCFIRAGSSVSLPVSIVIENNNLNNENLRFFSNMPKCCRLQQNNVLSIGVMGTIMSCFRWHGRGKPWL